MLGGGNGTVCWAEQWVPSGETALILAAGPLWMVLLPWLFRRAPRAAFRGAGRRRGRAGRRGDCWSAACRGRAGRRRAPLCFGGGSALLGRQPLLGRRARSGRARLPLPKETALATAMEMLAASPLLAVAALAHGEWGRFHPAAVTPGAWVALAYLVVFGSLAGFGSYVFLLKHTSPARAFDLRLRQSAGRGGSGNRRRRRADRSRARASRRC